LIPTRLVSNANLSIARICDCVSGESGVTNIREWLNKGDKSSARMTRLLPILIRQARLETEITYGDVARELGVHHRAVHRVAGHIG
jgi:hypothetical protein